MAAVIKDKYINKLSEEFMNGINSSDTEDLKKKIVISETEINAIELAKENDQELERLREEVKEKSAPYRESKALETAKIKYCLYILEERGASVQRD